MLDYVMTKEEEEDYSKNGIASSRLKTIWNDFISGMPKELRWEMIGKKYFLVPHPLIDDARNSISYNVMFKVEDASPELKKYLEDSDKNIIICMNDEI